jgi:hypothetical protein
VPSGELPRWSAQKASECHGDNDGCSVSVDFARTKEGRERENSAVFCGRGGLVKGTRGEVRCRVHVEERRGSGGRHGALPTEADGGRGLNGAADRWSPATVPGFKPVQTK